MGPEITMYYRILGCMNLYATRPVGRTRKLTDCTPSTAYWFSSASLRDGLSRLDPCERGLQRVVRGAQLGEVCLRAEGGAMRRPARRGAPLPRGAWSGLGLGVEVGSGSG